MNRTKSHHLTISLNSEAHEVARKFATQQDTVEKGKQVYLNTLAVYAVHSFLEWMNIESDISQGDSWHPAVRCFQDVADLFIPSLGKLECRPILEGATFISLPPEVTENRIGYVAVQFEEQLKDAQLLGFCPALDPQDIPNQLEIAELQPIEGLIDYLFRLELVNDFFQSEDEVVAKVKERLNAESFSEISAQLERIYRTYDKDEWRFAGGDFLANYMTNEKGVSWKGTPSIIDREEFNESQQSELQDLAEELLEKLAEIWGDEESDEQVVIEPPASASNSVKVPSETPNILFYNIVSAEGFVNLSEWLQSPESLFIDEFETLESFLSKQQGNQIFRYASAPRSRSAETEKVAIAATRARKVQLTAHLLDLLVSCQRENEGIRDILLRLYPTGDNTYLPSGVQLIVLDESGDIFLEAQARSADNWIQLEFRGEPGERFSVKVGFDDDSITRDFVI